jgi:hypothetical protein
MNYPSKRQHNEIEEIIDVPFLLKQERILSEKEFKVSIIGKMTYNEYFNKFLFKRAEMMFEEYKEADWFKDRYISGVPYNQQHVHSVGNAIVARNLIYNEKLKNFLQSLTEAKAFFISQNDKKYNFTIDLYVIPNDASQDQICDKLLKEFDCKTDLIDLAKCIVPANSNQLNQITDQQIKAMFEELCKLEDVDEKAVTDEYVEKNGKSYPLTKDDFLNIFKTKFNFCPVCCKKFDNPIEMNEKCVKHGGLCSRSIDIFCYLNNIEILSNFQSSEKLKEFYAKTSQLTFKCLKCDKIFGNEEQIKNHMMKKHDSFDSSEYSGLIVFLKNFDFFSMNMCLGMDEKCAPTFFKNPIDNNCVVYDMPTLFSGKF